MCEDGALAEGHPVRLPSDNSERGEGWMKIPGSTVADLVMTDCILKVSVLRPV